MLIGNRIIGTIASGPSQGIDEVVVLSILLWAGALCAIVILILYLWRRYPSGSRQLKDDLPEPLHEGAPGFVTMPAANPTGEEVKTAFQQGVALVHAGKAEAGFLELRKVITAEPKSAVAWFWLGIASVRQEDNRTAERCFLQARKHGHPEADKALEWLRKQKT